MNSRARLPLREPVGVSSVCGHIVEIMGNRFFEHVLRGGIRRRGRGFDAAPREFLLMILS